MVVEMVKVVRKETTVVQIPFPDEANTLSNQETLLNCCFSLPLEP